MKPTAILDHTPTSVAVTGRNLRPFLRGNVGNLSAQFFVESPTSGEIRVPSLPPGVYDVSLWDEASRVALAPRALTVQATDVSSVINLEAAGTFFAVAKDVAPTIAVGARLSGAEILAVQPPVPTTRRVRIGPAMFMMATLPSPSVTAIVRIPCTVSQGACTFGTVAVQRGVTLLLPVPPPGPEGQVPFVVDQLFPAGTHAAFPSVVTARVRFVGGPEISSVIRAGETDVTPAIALDADRTPILDGIHASVTAVSDSQPVTVQLATEPQMNANPLRRTFQFPLAGIALTGTVRIPVVFTPLGWSYKDRLVKVGAPFVFESMAGTVTGWIVDVKPDAVP
jgi:hypothetical protein